MTQMISWRETIQIARKRGTFTFDEHMRACSWETCAVGEQRGKHPDTVRFHPVPYSSPIDTVLGTLGSSMVEGFAVSVGRNDFDAADDILDAIEDRVLELKRQS